MISKINPAEFSERLNKNTKYGSPRILGTPFSVFYAFGESEKIFFGTYNKTKFELTKNTIIYATPFIISGEFKSKKNNQTEINYELKPIGFGYYWLKYFPLIAFVMFNLTFYSVSESFEIVLIMNSIIAGLALFLHFSVKWKKKKLENDFIKIFEIEA
ncbi:MAG: hypothetical protein ABIQ27_03880 [Flavobacterium sp.]|uniref:hypothetical protein n=1 Tax=Flavobacterium sp. TaxID=239 RepID=UPI0032675A62